jgi:hypothetical protein
MMNNMSQGIGSFNMTPQNTLMQQNPYGQQMRSPEMFSEQLMAPNQMAPMQDPMQGLQPMSQPAGFGVYGQSLEGYAEGGEAVPRETEIMGQPHMLAYINPEEEMMLRQMGGSGMAGPGGVPSYVPGYAGSSTADKGGKVKINNSNKNKSGGFKDEEKRSFSFSPVVNLISNLLSGPTPSEPRGNPAASGERLQNIQAEEKAMKAETPTSIGGALTQIKDDVKMGIGSLLFGQETTPGYRGRSRQSSAYAAEVEKKRQQDDDRDASRAAAAAEAAAAANVPAGESAGTGIDTLTGPGTVGVNYGGAQPATGGFTPSSDFDTQTGEIFGGGNTYGSMADGSQLIQTLTPNGYVYEILDPSGSSVTNTFDNYQEAYAYATGTPYTPPAPIAPAPVAPAPVVAPDPIVAPDPVVSQPVVPPAATVDPITPVGGSFLLPGQQNFGPTPSAALNFNPNTYMQTPQNANVALPEMFQESRPYTFEELLSQYKPAYPVNQ